MSSRSVILNSNNWEEFNQNLVKLDNKEKGDAFELLTKYFFKVEPKYIDLYKEVWIHHELPIKVKKELNYFQDRGIDLVAETKSGEYHAIQCKYHSDKDKNVTLKELSTFFTNYESRDKLTVGYVCSSANGFSKNIKSSVSKQLQYILSDKWQSGIDEYMWAIHKYIKEKAFNIRPHDPRDHQLKAIKEAKEHFKKESRGKLIFPCGAGKSLTGFWFTQELKSKNTLIAVPSLSLIKQTLDVYLREIVANKKKVKWLCICSDDGIGRDDDIVFKTENIGVPCQTDPEYIENWLKENKNENKIIFTTYQSGKIIAELSKKLKISFDLGIFDEAHKTVGSSKKLFSHLLFEKNISIEKRIFMTATERFYGGQKSEDIISMDDEDIYGDTFSMMSFKEAINANLLTDYKVITIDVKKKEISDFIRENKLVELNGNWAKESESRALASMLALRKAMTLFPITNAVSFHSSIERAKRNLSLQDYITETYNYEPIDTFTVKGKDPTSLRSKIIREFAESKKALITNARCLTEGIDVPNIDCIIFTDPKRSKVDIVQALGRALRKKEGKDWGYVILPVIYDDKTNEIDNDNFDDILSVVRGLAANDERIVDYFKLKESERLEKSKAGERIFNFEVFSEYIDESELKENLQIKLWEKLSKFQWMPFEEAREYVQGFNFKSRLEFDQFRIKGLIDNVPSNPDKYYKNNGWSGYGDFLGRISHLDKVFLKYEEAEKKVRKLEIKNWKQYEEYVNNNKFCGLPKAPNQLYKNKGWKSFKSFIGKEIKYLDFVEAKKYVRKLSVKTVKDWVILVKKNKIPENIPSYPEKVYKNKGWKGYPDWLGNNQIWVGSYDYKDFISARKFARKLNLKSGPEWRKYCKSGEKPQDIPSNPYRIYKEFQGIGDWLGIKTHLDKNFLTFVEAKKTLKKLKIKSIREYNKLYNTKNFNLPSAPPQYYKNDGWKSWGDFLNTGTIAPYKIKFKNFKEAKKFVVNLKLKSRKDWFEYRKSGNRPIDIPSNPDAIYRDKGFKGYNDFLGIKTKVGGQRKNFISFKNAKEFSVKLNLFSSKEWIKFHK